MPARKKQTKRPVTEAPKPTINNPPTQPLYRLREVLKADGTLPFSEWLNGLRDRMAKVRVAARLVRFLGTGNLGDHRERMSGAISEMRVDYGPGYRVYYVQSGDTIILLMFGGTKDTQQNDIEEATRLWEYCKDDHERFSREHSGNV